MNEKFAKIFSKTECLTEDIMYKYLKGRLSDTEKHYVEKHLTDCEMCTDALEGLSLMYSPEEIKTTVKNINKAIDRKLKVKRGRIFFLQDYRIKVAAAIIVLAIISSVVYYFGIYLRKKPEKIFAEHFEPYQVTPEITEREQTDKVNQSKFYSDEASTQIPESEGLSKEGEYFSENIGLIEDKSTNKKSTEGEIKSREKIATITVNEASVRTLADSGKTGNIAQTIIGAKQPVKLATTEEIEEPAYIAKNTAQTSSSQDTLKNKTLTVAGTVGGEDLALQQQKEQILAEKKKKEKEKVSKYSARGAETQAPADETGKAGIDKKVVEIAEVKSDTIFKNAIPEEESANVRYDYKIDIVQKMKVAMNEYEAKKYDSAIIHFEEILSYEHENYNALFYSAISYLTLNNPDKAIKNFNKILKAKSAEFYQASQWYKALALIKKNDINEAKKLLNKIIEENSEYKEKAIKTLEELK